jgi:hypothetical protein
MVEHRLFACRDLLRTKVSTVAIGRRVHKQQQPLRAFRRGGARLAILGAHVNGRRGRQPIANQDIVELPAVVMREKHIVSAKGEAVRPRRRRPGQG